MASDQAANTLFRAVRDFALQTADWDDAIRYFTKPDERFDLTLVSYRVYGTNNETLVIQAAAGIDSAESEMPEQLLVLPTVEKLRAMRRDAGYDGYEV